MEERVIEKVEKVGKREKTREEMKGEENYIDKKVERRKEEFTKSEEESR